MSGDINEEIINSFLNKVMEIEEKPMFMLGSNITARREKLSKCLEDFSIAENFSESL